MAIGRRPWDRRVNFAGPTSYTPEANPDEYLNRDLKTVLRSQEPKRTAHDLWSAARAFMEFLQRTPERVRAYFTHPSVHYAR